MADDAGSGPDRGATDPDVDPRLGYPRGNRLGLRQPRPTVVVLIVLVALLGAAFAWTALRPPEAQFCELTGSTGNPVAADADAAFEAWLAQGGAEQAARLATRSSGPGPVAAEAAPPRAEDFASDGAAWTWKVDDHVMVKVEVGGPSDDAGGYQVAAVNRCWYGTGDELSPS